MKKIRENVHLGFLSLAFIIGTLAYLVITNLEPYWTTSLFLRLSLAIGIGIAVTSFISAARKAYGRKSSEPISSGEIQTKVISDGNSIAIGGSVQGDVIHTGEDTKIHTGTGDIVDEKIKVGRDFVKVAGDYIAGSQTGFNALHQLTPPPGDFTGRAEELDELRRMIRGQGATITGLRGMGGIGKTALARMIAQELKDDYPDAQIELNLKGVTEETLSPEDALAYIIRSFHPDADLPDGRAQLEAIYRSTLYGKRALLLMDNARDAAQVEPLLPPEGSLLLVTSRKRFTLAGLEPLELGVMEEAEAVELLTTISARTEVHAPKIAELCDYLPLALRLAASALKQRPNLTPKRYIQRLKSERLKTLDLAADDTEERPGVAATLQLSYDLLSNDLQRLWRGLAVFPQDFSTQAALYITQGFIDTNTQIERKGVETILDETGDQLAELVGYSLLEYDPENRRCRLHELGREFADLKLEQGGEKKARQRTHAQYYFGILEMTNDWYLQGDQSMLQGLRMYDLEAANIQAGQSWAAQQMEGDKIAAELAANYPTAGAPILSLRLHAKDWINWLKTALAVTKQTGDRRIQGTTLGNLGLAYHLLGEYEKAIDFHQQALAISREIGDHLGQGTVLGNLGITHFSLGDYPKAIDFHQQQLDFAIEIGDRRIQSNALGNLGNAYLELKETKKAIGFYRQALDIGLEIGDLLGQGNALRNLGIAYDTLGETEKAVGFYRQALTIYIEISDRHGQGDALGSLGSAYFSLENYPKAIAFHQQQLDLAIEIGDSRVQGNALGSLGNSYDALGETEKAIGFQEKNLQIAIEIGDRHGQGIALGRLGVSFWKSGQRDQAIIYTVQAFHLCNQLGVPQAWLALRELAQRATEMGAEAFQIAIIKSGLTSEALQVVLHAMEQYEQEQPDLRQDLVANTIDVLTVQLEKKEEWRAALGQIQDQAKDEEITELVIYLDLLRRLVEGADPANLAGDVPEEFKVDWAEIEKGLKGSDRSD